MSPLSEPAFTTTCCKSESFWKSGPSFFIHFVDFHLFKSHLGLSPNKAAKCPVRLQKDYRPLLGSVDPAPKKGILLSIHVSASRSILHRPIFLSSLSREPDSIRSPSDGQTSNRRSKISDFGLTVINQNHFDKNLKLQKYYEILCAHTLNVGAVCVKQEV